MDWGLHLSKQSQIWCVTHNIMHFRHILSSSFLPSLQGDKEGRAVWLGSSNIDNTRFYERHGFATIATVTLGEDDPTWNEPPIVLKLVCLHPRLTSVVDLHALMIRC